MEIDLATVEAPVEAVRSQVCVVGAGIAGLVLARKLALAGVDVVVLEAGGRSIEDAGQRLFAEAELRGQPHVGTTRGAVSGVWGNVAAVGRAGVVDGWDGADGWPVGAGGVEAVCGGG